MEKKMDVKKIAIVGLGIALNIVGAFVALMLRLPIYMDSIGTIMVACLLGPRYAILTGVGGSLISGMTFDIYSLYFAPVQISTGLFAGYMYRSGLLSGKKTPLGVFIVTLPTSIISAIIAAKLFGGVTSSGSSYIVQLLKVIGMPDVASVFVTQVVTDYVDKFVAVILVAATYRVLPGQFRKYKTEA